MNITVDQSREHVGDLRLLVRQRTNYAMSWHEEVHNANPTSVRQYAVALARWKRKTYVRASPLV